MHTTRIEVEGVSYYCNHNGDFSGDVDIFRRARPRPGDGQSPYAHPLEAPPDQFIATVPYAIMEALVGEKLKSNEMSKLEDISGSKFLHSIFNYHDIASDIPGQS
jgi:hypothetical protein